MQPSIRIAAKHQERNLMTRTLVNALILICAGGLASLAIADVTFVSIDDIRSNADVLAQTDRPATGQPDVQILKSAADAGYVAVVDLRTEGEDRGMDEAAEVSALGMKYISIPISGRTGLTFENAATLESTLAEFDGPVLVHCASGNRVGALVALSAKQHGASSDEAIAAGKSAGLTRSEPAVRELIEAK